jgi:hypothetical protein
MKKRWCKNRGKKGKHLERWRMKGRKGRKGKRKRKRRKKICCNEVNGKYTVWNRKS